MVAACSFLNETQKLGQPHYSITQVIRHFYFRSRTNQEQKTVTENKKNDTIIQRKYRSTMKNKNCCIYCKSKAQL